MVCMLAGGPISWSSTLQKTCAQSTAEAEYMALADVVKEAIWLRNKVTDCGVPQTSATPVHEDNQACILLARSGYNHRRVKHVDVRHHLVRDAIDDGVVTLLDTDTKDHLAGLFTKNVQGDQFQAIVSELMHHAL